MHVLGRRWNCISVVGISVGQGESGAGAMAGTRSRTLELSSPGFSESVEAWGGRDSSLGSPQQLGRWMGQTILLPVTAPAAGTGGQAGCYLHSMTSSL